MASGPSRWISSAGSAPPGSSTTRSEIRRRAARRGGAQHGLLAGAVRVEGEQHGRGHPRQLAELLGREGRAHQTDGVSQAGLVHGDHVGVALAKDHLARARGVRTGKVSPVKVQALVVDLVIGAVQVFRSPAVAEGPGPEAEHAAADIAQRKHDAAP